MSLVALFTRRLPPPCWLRAYQTSSTRLCNPKTPAAAPVPPVLETKEPVTASTPVESDKPIKEDNVVHQSAEPSEPAKPIEPSEPPPEPAASTAENVKPLAAAAEPVQAPLPPKTKEPAPEQSKGPVVAPATPSVPSPSILSAITGLRHSPAPALGLGLAGLIPFVAAPAYMVLVIFYKCRLSSLSVFLQYNAGVFLPSIATAQLTYGATILSFLGGVHKPSSYLCHCLSLTKFFNVHCDEMISALNHVFLSSGDNTLIYQTPGEVGIACQRRSPPSSNLVSVLLVSYQPF